METVKKEAFKIIGIKVRTTNENGQAANDIGMLWQKFISENTASKIPNKIDHSIFSIYTNYQKDHTEPYDVILGCRVSSLDEIPKEMIGQTFEKGNYAQFTAKGDLSKGVVYQAWTEIWNKNLNRTYSADFEIYGEKAQNPEDAEVDIFIAVN